MLYVIPSQRNKIDNNVLPPKQHVVQLCRWCHKPGHLSFTCKFKGTVLEKKPNMVDNDSFPSLDGCDKSIHSPLENNKWGSSFSLDSLREKTKKIDNNTIKRNYSSNISLDSLTSTGSYDSNELFEYIHNTNDYMEKEHPYTSYYKYLKKDICYDPAFNMWWMVELDQSI